MNRQIKFRGKRLDHDEWVYGDLIHIDDSDIGIVTDYDHWQGCRVDPETVGQFTGMIDKNGKEICEGDIVEMGKYTGEVRWMPGKCCFQLSPGGVFLSRNCTVLGNIYDGYKLNENKE